MKKRRLFSVICLVLAAVIVISACAQQGTPEADSGLGLDIPEGHPLEHMEFILQQFPQTLDTGESHVEGTTFMFGIGATSPIPGKIGGAIFSDMATENYIGTLLGTVNSLTSMDSNFHHGQDGVATFEYDLDAQTITLTMQHDVYWHDGTPLTMRDLLFTYEVLGHPDVQSIRLTDAMLLIEGYQEFIDGEVDYISGIVLSNNDRTITFHMLDMPITLLYAGDQLSTVPMARHIFENIPVADMPSSDAVLVNPIGWGPFMIEHIVPGDAYEMVRNENYVFGVPQIERLRVERFDPAQAGELMAAGRFDYMIFPNAQYEYHRNPTNFTFLGAMSDNADHIAFMFGYFDWDEGVNVMVYDSLAYRLGPDFRRAMAYAIDRVTFSQTMLNGLAFPAHSIMTPMHLDLLDLEMPGFPFDPDKANQILDDAGFTERDAEGYRMFEGEPLTLNWALMESPLEEEIHALYTQNWRDIGIRVELWLGRTHDLNFLYDTMDMNPYVFDEDMDDVHLYSAGWHMGVNPNPSGIWGHSFWNTNRYTTVAYQDILARMSGAGTWDPDYKRQVYSDWQWYWFNNVPAIPMYWRIDLHAVNNRVTHWETRPWMLISGNQDWTRVGLSAPDPIS